jgi:hypothetical protein
MSGIEARPLSDPGRQPDRNELSRATPRRIEAKRCFQIENEGIESLPEFRCVVAGRNFAAAPRKGLYLGPRFRLSVSCFLCVDVGVDLFGESQTQT